LLRVRVWLLSSHRTDSAFSPLNTTKRFSKEDGSSLPGSSPALPQAVTAARSEKKPAAEKLNDEQKSEIQKTKDIQKLRRETNRVPNSSF
jgi:hypothetical protein